MDKELNKAELAIYGSSAQNLMEIYHKLNTWEWDGRLGGKPKDWDILPSYNTKLIHKLIRRKTKCDYIEPLTQLIYFIAKEEIELEQKKRYINERKTALERLEEKRLSESGNCN